MSTRDRIEALIKHPVTRDLGEELLELWEKHGKPEPSGGPTTEAHAPFTHIDATDIEVSEENEGAVGEYNELLDNIFEVVDIRHVGAGFFYTQYYSNEKFSEFCEDARDAIQDFVAYRLWDEFNSWYDWV